MDRIFDWIKIFLWKTKTNPDLIEYKYLKLAIKMIINKMATRCNDVNN
jgi:hypothetical protein